MSEAEGDSPVERTYVEVSGTFLPTIRNINLAEELLERVAANNVCIGLQSRLSKGFLQELRHV